MPIQKRLTLHSRIVCRTLIASTYQAIILLIYNKSLGKFPLFFQKKNFQLIYDVVFVSFSNSEQVGGMLVAQHTDINTFVSMMKNNRLLMGCNRILI